MEINLEVLYILIGIIYFIYSVIKNFTKKPVTRQEEPTEEVEEERPQRPHRRETVSTPFDERVDGPAKRKPSSFEELLQEFDKKSTDSRHKGAAEEKVKKMEEVDDEFEPAYDMSDTEFTEKEAERRIRETESRKALQEKATAVERAEAVDDELHRKIRTTTTKGVSSEKAPEERKKSVGNQQGNARRQQILQMLKHPDYVTNTIVASEILQRKEWD